MRGVAGVLAPSADAVVLPELSRAATVRTAAVAGLVAGVVSFAAYDALPAPWDRLGGSAGLWCLLTWWAGRRVRPPSLPWAALAGLVTQLCLLAGFYGALVVLAGRGEDPRRVLAWAVLALLAGPLFGALGTLRWVRGWPASASAALAGAAVALEPLVGVAESTGPADEDLWWCAAAAVLGLVVAAAGAPRGRWLQAVALAVVVVAVGAGAVAVLAGRQLGLL